MSGTTGQAAALVNTRKVGNRRALRYRSLAELRDDAIGLAAAEHEVTCLGNWSQGQIYRHLAQSLDMSIDGTDFAMPAPVRWMMALMMKRKFLKQQLPAGFKAPSSLQPAETSTATGLAELECAIERQQQENSRAPHPAFGRLTSDEWNDFHLRHAELHMSFLLPRN